MVQLSVEEFSELCDSILARHGFEEDEARLCTEEIVDAERRGRVSHGAAIIPEVVEWKTGTSGKPIELAHETSISAHIVGNDAVGPVVAKMAMDLAIKKAKENSIGLIGVDNKWPFILAGYHPRRAAAEGLVGICWSVAISKVALWGGSDPVIGTNPIAVAIPGKDAPVVLDMAITEIAAAEIRRAKKLGQTLPEGVAIGSDGKNTRDPGEALEGAMLPFDGYKGSGLGVVIELLGGPLVGAKAGKSVPGNRGMVFLAIDPDVFGYGGQFADAVTTFVHEAQKSRPRPGSDRVQLPGERSDHLFAKSARDGVEIEESVHQELLMMRG